MPEKSKARPKGEKRRSRAVRYWIGAAVLVVGVLVVVLLWQRDITSYPASTALTSADQVQRITPAEAKALLDRGQAVLCDVRARDSFQAKHATGALSLPEEQIESLVNTLPKGKALILY